MENPLTLPKKQRLAKNAEFRYVLTQKKRCSDRYFVVHMAGNDLAVTRMGVSIGRAQGNAVQRNRIKRLVREVFRVHQHDMPVGIDILVTMCKPPGRTKRSKQSGDQQKRPDLYWPDVEASLLKLIHMCYRKLHT